MFERIKRGGKKSIGGRSNRKGRKYRKIKDGKTEIKRGKSRQGTPGARTGGRETEKVRKRGKGSGGWRKK